jgi:hypothetical protein
MVDELRRWPHATGIFKKGSSHLTTDGPLHELHAFALRIGLRLSWFQAHRVPHYDLTWSRHHVALRSGAVFVPAREQARRRRALIAFASTSESPGRSSGQGGSTR